MRISKYYFSTSLVFNAQTENQTMVFFRSGQNRSFERSIFQTYWKLHCVTQCGGLSLRCHRATVYWDIKIQWTSAKSYMYLKTWFIKTHNDSSNYVQCLGHSKSFIFVSSHPKSSWVTKTSYVGGPSIQYLIYCDLVVTTNILCTLTFIFFLKKLKKMKK